MIKQIYTQATRPHEILLFNLSVVHFLLPAILFGTKQLSLIFSIPVVCSLVILSTIGIQAKRRTSQNSYIQAHWQLAWQRSQYLILAYGVSLSLFLIAWLLTQNAVPHARTIHLAVAGWFALVPLSITIVVLLILENSAWVQARKGVLPKDMRI